MRAHVLGLDTDEMPPRTPSVRCQIVVRGVLSDTLMTAFPSLHVAARGGVTVLEGELADQSALFGVLAQVEALGLELLEIRRLGP